MDAIFLFISTYALSHTVLPVAQEARVPIIVLNLQPVPAIDYAAFNALGDRGVMTGEWLAHCQACCAPEIANVFNNCGIDYHLVTGWLKEDCAWSQIGAWVDAIAVRREIRDTRVGILGHYYAGMLDVYTDVTRLAGRLRQPLRAHRDGRAQTASRPGERRARWSASSPSSSGVRGVPRVRRRRARARRPHLVRA